MQVFNCIFTLTLKIPKQQKFPKSPMEFFPKPNGNFPQSIEFSQTQRKFPNAQWNFLEPTPHQASSSSSLNRKQNVPFHAQTVHLSTSSTLKTLRSLEEEHMQELVNKSITSYTCNITTGKHSIRKKQKYNVKYHSNDQLEIKERSTNALD